VRGIASLVFLSLSSCRLNHRTGVGVGLIGLATAAMSGSLSNVEVLRIEDNDLNDEEGVAVVALLRYMPRLESLHLTDNCLMDGTATALASAARLGVLPSLADLYLRDNFISWRGARKINYVLAMDMWPTLSLLTIDLNRITPYNMTKLYYTQARLRLSGRNFDLDQDLGPAL
jgi:Ran GTPase-activating protein (RanGAP) involved in mRNA processing and transport